MRKTNDNIKKYVEPKRTATKIVWQKKRGMVIEFWESLSGRWYWHKKVNGRVTADGSYSSRRATRRALRNMFGEPD